MRDYIGKKVLITECVYHSLNGTEAKIIEQEINEENDLIFALNISHPEDESTFLWVNEMDINIINL